MSISTDAPTSGTASIAFVDCEISAGAGPSSGGGVHAHAHRRWEVVIAGKRTNAKSVMAEKCQKQPSPHERIEVHG